MHDPWDVTTTRRSDQYISCMKIHGVPLLPPVLSRECRKEMQYYKALALEVEKRISLLKAFSDESKTKTRTLSITECEENENECKIIATIAGENKTFSVVGDPDLVPDDLEGKCSNVTVTEENDNSLLLSSPKLVIGVIGDIFKEKLKDKTDVDTPERDYNCFKSSNVKASKDNEDSNENHKDVITKRESYTVSDVISPKKLSPNDSPRNNANLDSPVRLSPTKDAILKNTGPSSLSSSKSFDDIHAELGSPTKLVRQRSYTVLNPGPALLAHLEVQSLTSGVEISAISMSESCSNLSWLSKKRKSWDLESAKVKWSSMASELNTKKNMSQNVHVARTSSRVQSAQQTTKRTKSIVSEKSRRGSVSSTRTVTASSSFVNGTPKSVQKSNASLNKSRSPTRKESKINTVKQHSPGMEKDVIDDLDIVNREFTTKLSMLTSDNYALLPPIHSAADTLREDPSTCIRELYEKIRNQQLLRMASLIEKQKKEKELLQQVFEEQNSLFYKQLKTICPTSPKEIKKAWTEKAVNNDYPVSLSQLINGRSSSDTETVVLSSALNESQTYISKTDEALKRGRNVRQNSTTKSKSVDQASPYALNSQPKSVPSNIIHRAEKSGHTSCQSNRAGQNSHSSRMQVSSNSSSRSEVEPMLTDRTDNTLADLNFTLTSDDNADYYPELLTRDYTFIMENKKDNKSAQPKSPKSPKSPVMMRCKSGRSGSIDSNIDTSFTKDCSVRRSTNDRGNPEMRSARKLFTDKPATFEERLAASRIVAHARGYLTRRLLRTERVQATVQTIRDALVCALQLHQDREGIRGADIDLHRRLIQQITAACYSLHDTFIQSSPKERCALIAQDRERQRALEEKQLSNSYSLNRPATTPTRRINKRKSCMTRWSSRGEDGNCSGVRSDAMWHSQSGVSPAREATLAMTRSSHEFCNYEDKSQTCTPDKYVAAARKEYEKRRPWR